MASQREPARRNFEASFDAVHLYGLRFNEAGELFDSNGVLEHGFATRHSWEHRDRARFERRAKRLERDLPLIKGECFWITDRLSHFYYHWFCDALPRLEAFVAGQGRNLPLLLPGRVAGQSFVRESLKAWPGLETVIATGSGQVETLRVTARAAETPQIDGPMVNAVAERLINHFDNGTRIGGRRIYVTRIDARIRRVINELALAPVLRKHGFETVLMGRLPLAEQARLMMETDVLMGPHGGGLTNMLYMKPGAKVIELRREYGPPPCYRNLAMALGHDWRAIDGVPNDPKMHAHAADIEISPQSLDALLSTLQPASISDNSTMSRATRSHSPSGRKSVD